MEASESITVNVGVLGHVDSGKTSICAALSQVLGTAALDRNPQSQERGITLDLQFSALNVERDGKPIRVCLVDCPGHASLLRTIVGGAHIIDVAMLVVDVTKGIQTQTAECLVVAMITTGNLLILLNKIDLVPPAERQSQIEKVRQRIHRALEGTRYAPALKRGEIDMIPFSAKPQDRSPPCLTFNGSVGVEEVKEWFARKCKLPVRDRINSPLLVAVDHCFALKGKGTVCTGTILRGQLAVNDAVEIPNLHEVRRVKSLQVFHQPVNRALQGERVGILLPGLEPQAMERGLLAAPNTVRYAHYAVSPLHKIKYYKGDIKTHSKFHATVGHTTTLAMITLFRGPLPSPKQTKSTTEPPQSESSSGDVAPQFDEQAEYRFETVLPFTPPNAQPSPNEEDFGHWWVLLHFEHPIALYDDALLIASRLDTDIHTPTCRLAFHGKIQKIFNTEEEVKSLKIIKTKTKRGEVERIQDEYTLIGRGLFKKETDMNLFTGMKVIVQPEPKNPPKEGEEPTTYPALDGKIEGAFGKSGKFKVRVQSGGLMKYANNNQITLTITLTLKRFAFAKGTSILFTFSCIPIPTPGY